jgi:putative nucleotidyltransferase with HDIG domain
VRFASQLGFRVDGAALAAIPGALRLTATVSPERIREELDKTIASQKPSAGLLLMEETGLLELLLPELAACRNIDQGAAEAGVPNDAVDGLHARQPSPQNALNVSRAATRRGFHRFDVLDHSLLACDFAAAENYPAEVRLAALYHDLGKPLTRKLDDSGVWTFYRHEEESSRLARELFLRYRYSNAVSETVCHLIEQHMFHYTEDWTDAAVRRFVIRAGEESLPDLYRLRRADAFATAGHKPPPDFLLALQTRVENVLAAGRALSLKDLAVSGGDLMTIGVAPGKKMGLILGELLEAVIDDPALNTREKLLEIAGNMNRR